MSRSVAIIEAHGQRFGVAEEMGENQHDHHIERKAGDTVDECSHQDNGAKRDSRSKKHGAPPFSGEWFKAYRPRTCLAF